MKIREITQKNYPKLLKLNNENLPAVSELSIEGLEKLHEQSLGIWIIEDSASGNLAGFCIILPPNIDYSSDNYKWISERYHEFEYLDRVVIPKEFRGQGFGRAIYEHWFKLSRFETLLLEVNIKPMNEASILFHEKMGFHAVGEQDTSGGEKRVQYMLRGTCSN